MAIVVPIVSEWNPRGLNRAIADIQAAEGRMGKIGAATAAAAPAAAVALAGIGAAAVYAAAQASTLEQAEGAVTSVFADQAAKVMEAARAAQQIGLSQAQYGQQAALLGSKLKALGTSQADLAPQSERLIRLGADLAATYGGTTADAVSALSSLLSGETDPIERYGASIKQSDVNARLAAQGMSGLEGEAAKQAETQARLALLFEQTASAQGQAGRESESTAARWQRLQATVANLAAEFGERLLPYLEKMGAAGERALAWIGENQGAVTAIIAGVAALAVGIVSLNIAFKAMEVARAAAVAVRMLNAALMANPVGLIVAGIMLIIAAVIYAYNRFDWFREGVQTVWNAVKTAVAAVVGWFQAHVAPVLATVANLIIAYYRTLWGALQAIWSGIRAAVNSVVGWFQAYVAPVLSAVANAVSSAFSWLRGVVSAVWSGIQSAVSWAVNGVNAAMATVSGVIDVVSNAWHGFASTVQGVWDTITSSVQRAVDWVTAKIQALRDALAGVPLIGSLVGGDSRTTLVTEMVGPTSYGTGSTTSVMATSSAPVVINIHGALDPVAVGRQIEQLLGGYRQAVGRTWDPVPTP